MAEPVWELFVTITSSSLGVAVGFDFNTYNYRARPVGDFEVNVYKDRNETRNLIFTAPFQGFVVLYEGMGDATGKLIQGQNILLTSASFYTAIIERSIKWTPPNLKMNVSGSVMEFDKGWVNIDGQLKEIDKMWTRIDNVLKEI